MNSSTPRYPISPLTVEQVILVISSGLRVALVVRELGNVTGAVNDVPSTTYHFVKSSSPGPSEEAFQTSCCYYSSILADPLKLIGDTLLYPEMTGLLRYLLSPKGYSLSKKSYIATAAYILPTDWYECFEVDREARMDSIREQVASLGRRADQVPVHPVARRDIHDFSSREE